MKRAIRRHHKHRMKQRAQKLLKNHHGGFEGYLLRRFANRRADNFSTCSCVMCGNPRKNLGRKTKEEKIAEYSFQEQVEESL